MTDLMNGKANEKRITWRLKLIKPCMEGVPEEHNPGVVDNCTQSPRHK